MRASRKISEANIYHVIARGVGRQIIFEDDNDRERFLELMKENLASKGDVLAWCLMDNHFHILIELEMKPLSDAMRRMLSAYATYFNMRHDRSGHLFQDRFGSEAVDTEEYLLTVLRYIHQNPVKSGISPTCSYRWSSYEEYLSDGGICSVMRIRGIFGSREEYMRFHESEEGDACLDVAPKRARVSDEQALLIARRLLGDNPASGICSLGREARDRALRNLRDEGLTIRQIQRATGVGKGIIQRV